MECAAAEPFMPDGIARLLLSSEVQLPCSVEFCFRGCRNKEFREGLPVLSFSTRHYVQKLRVFFRMQEFLSPSSCGLTGQQYLPVMVIMFHSVFSVGATNDLVVMSVHRVHIDRRTLIL